MKISKKDINKYYQAGLDSIDMNVHIEDMKPAKTVCWSDIELNIFKILLMAVKQK